MGKNREKWSKFGVWHFFGTSFDFFGKFVELYSFRVNYPQRKVNLNLNELNFFLNWWAYQKRSLIQNVLKKRMINKERGPNQNSHKEQLAKSKVWKT